MNISHDIDFELSRIRRVAYRMDAIFFIPGTNISIGFDTLLGLIPVVGDAIAALPALWMIRQAHQLGASPGTLAYMTLNTTLDFAIGSIPIAGDIFDALYKANIRNYKALARNLEKRAASAREVKEPDPHLLGTI
ncbi:DUF4112 domain-containing protein [Loktanella agnita]|uniref:DUF4112 domain-containing protein n=1 Tax=Loktanella agnita TaxID=287097 RepID=UPI0039873CF4